MPKTIWLILNTITDKFWCDGDVWGSGSNPKAMIYESYEEAKEAANKLGNVLGMEIGQYELEAT